MSLPNSLKLSSRFDSFQKPHTVKPDPKIQIHFSPKHFYLRAFRCVQSLSDAFFDDLLIKFKTIVALSIPIGNWDELETSF